jgi:hypothetical protein
VGTQLLEQVALVEQVQRQVLQVHLLHTQVAVAVVEVQLQTQRVALVEQVVVALVFLLAQETREL